jgi:hypothetical protein
MNSEPGMMRLARKCIIIPVPSLESEKDRRAALVIAHPGHELRVYRWLSIVRPHVLVFTDGSSHSRQSRLSRTTSILNRLGGRPGGIYGRLTDAQFYSAILNRDVKLFFELAVELADELVRNNVEYVVGDAFEGYNPAHDVCRLVINAAIKKACLAGHCIDNFDMLLVNKASDHCRPNPTDMIWIEVNEHVLVEKLQAARDYSELNVDINRILEKEGVDSLRTECLRRVFDESSNELFKEPPYYEVYGETRVAAGYYQEVIRYRDHVLPIAEALGNLSKVGTKRLIADPDYQ